MKEMIELFAYLKGILTHDLFIPLCTLAGTLLLYLINKSIRNMTAYSFTESSYWKLQKIQLNNPSLSDYRKTSVFEDTSHKERWKEKYHAYAALNWTLIEVIYDEHRVWTKSLPKWKIFHTYLAEETWESLIWNVKGLHYSWFKLYSGTFKRGFQKYIMEEVDNVVIEAADSKDVDFKQNFPNHDEAFETLQCDQNSIRKLFYLKNKLDNSIIRNSHGIFLPTVKTL